MIMTTALKEAIPFVIVGAAGAGGSAALDLGWAVEILKQVPGLTVLAYIVVQFLKAQARREEASAQREQKRDEMFATAMAGKDELFAAKATECHEVQGRAINAIDANTRALATMETTLRDMRPSTS